MAGETIITVVGNLTADPELRYTQNGLAVVNFTIASTPRSFDRATNGWKDAESLFMRASVWREYAEQVAKSLTKGTRVIAMGRLVQQSFMTKPTDGSEPQKRTTFALEVDEIGPSLRYATVEVHRMARPDQQGGPQQGQPQNGQSSGGWAAEPPAQSGDVWNTPGSYGDETPF